MNIAYKVLCIENDKLFSANAYIKQEYFEKEINLPMIPGSKMFIFANIELAREFLDTETGDVIYKCLVEGMIKAPDFIPLAGNSSRNRWDNGKLEVIGSESRISPPGTYLCSSLYLLEKENAKV